MKKHPHNSGLAETAAEAEAETTPSRQQPRPNLRRLLLLVIFAAGLALGHFWTKRYGTQLPVTEGATLARPGPWGKMELIPITISAPDEILPVKGFEST